MSARVWQALAVVAVAWSLVASVGAVRAALAQPPDPMSRLEAEFVPLAPHLPPTGEVGYLEQHDGADEAAVRLHYAAQYALVPRVVLGRIGQEFIIVARGTDRPGGDPRLDGYFLVARTPGGHRVFRRLVP